MANPGPHLKLAPLPDASPKILPIRKAANRIGLRCRELRVLADLGLAPSIATNGDYFFDVAQLTAALKNLPGLKTTPPEWLSTYALAKLFRCSQRTVLRWSRRGKLPPPVMIYGSLRWRRSEVMAALGPSPALVGGRDGGTDA